MSTSHSETKTGFNKNDPFLAKITDRYSLTKPGGSKVTFHCVVDIAGSGIQYTAGDSLGVYCKNDPEHVQYIIEALNCTGKEQVVLHSSLHAEAKESAPISIYNALLEKLSLSKPSRKFLEFLKEKTASAEEKNRIDSLLSADNKEALSAYLSEIEYIDLLLLFPEAIITPQELVDHLRKLMPRMYSIASSSLAYPNEIHLTLAVLKYETHGRKRIGVATTYLAERAEMHTANLPVFLSESHFRLPEDKSKDVIMVGPGTGIAPFRAFIQERIHSNATGRNWLFFGERQREYDFLYGSEFLDWHEKGQLHRLDLAFSRDQADKIYVQNRLLENAAELWSWLEKGAYFYVCGDAKNMAKDVDAALHQICEEQGKLTPEATKDFIRQLKKDKRYQRDVY